MVSDPALFDGLFDTEPPATSRLLRAAQVLLFTYGYQAFTMDELAHELGMSKKTLYVHFTSKDAIIERIIDALAGRIHSRMEAVLSQPDLKFTQKVAGLVEVAGSTIGRINPTIIRDLQRFAPHLYQKIDDMRQRTIPVVFGKLLRDGIAEGKVRPDIDPAFATEFWFQAIRGLVHPATLERTQLTLPQALEKALHLWLGGMLTPAGRRDYEKHS